METLRQQVLDNFGRLAGKVLGRDVGAVDADTRLRDELGMTSTSSLELMLGLEDTLHIEINIELLAEKDLMCVGTLADFVVANAQPAG